MFEAFFNLTKTPFSRDIPEDALFNTPQLNELQGRLTSTASKRLFLVVTGDSGSGKTTAVRKFVSSLDTNRYIPFYISDSDLTPRNFYFEILNQIGVKPHFYRGDAKRQMIREFTSIVESKHVPLVIIDEAHLCKMEMLTEVRFLLNFKMDSYNPMGLILVGQSEIREILKKQVYEAISQRIDLRCHIPPFDRLQTGDYIKKHLEYAGESREIFTDRAIDTIFDFSGGLPRKINRVATTSLMHASQIEKRIIDDHMVSLIIEGELSW